MDPVASDEGDVNTEQGGMAEQPRPPALAAAPAPAPSDSLVSSTKAQGSRPGRDRGGHPPHPGSRVDSLVVVFTVAARPDRLDELGHTSGC